MVKPNGSTRMTQSRVRLEANEIAILLNIELPDKIFEKPQLEANITIPKDAIGNPKITAEVTDNMESVIKQATGMEVKIKVVDQEESNDESQDG